MQFIKPGININFIGKRKIAFVSLAGDDSDQHRFTGD